MSEQLFGRKVVFEAGQPGEIGVSLTGLPIVFDINIKLDGKPNAGSIGIRGASRDLYGICAQKGAVVRVLGGYTVPKLLFTGNPIPRIGVKYSHDGGSRLLAIQALDAGNKYGNTTLDLAISGQTTVGEVLTKAAAQLATPLAPVDPAISSTILPNGFYASGLVKSALAELASIAGFTWYLRDEALIVIPDGGETGEAAPVLSTRTKNLLKLELQKDGTITYTALLDGSIRPGRRIVFEHADFEGVAVARDTRFYGDPGWDVPFYVSGSARRFNG